LPENKIQGVLSSYERVQVKLKEGITAPRSFSDYDVLVDSDDLPNGQTT